MSPEMNITRYGELLKKRNEGKFEGPGISPEFLELCDYNCILYDQIC